MYVKYITINLKLNRKFLTILFSTEIKRSHSKADKLFINDQTSFLIICFDKSLPFNETLHL